MVWVPLYSNFGPGPNRVIGAGPDQRVRRRCQASSVACTTSRSVERPDYEQVEEALNLATGKAEWHTKVADLPLGAAMVSNDLVFTTLYHGVLIALNRSTGAIVFRHQLPTSANAPIAIADNTVIIPAGTPTTLEPAELPVPLPPSAVLAAYRIVQESLTNVVRHAGRVAATVSLRQDGGYLCVDVVNDGGTAPAAFSDGTGAGLAGMRERAAALGGTLDAGPRPGGGFAVHARQPVAAAAPGLDRVLRGSENPGPAATVLDDGQNVHLGAAQQAGGEEVQRQDRLCLGSQELGPARAVPAGAGSMPAFLRIRRTVDGATATPSARARHGRGGISRTYSHAPAAVPATRHRGGSGGRPVRP